MPSCGSDPEVWIAPAFLDLHESRILLDHVLKEVVWEQPEIVIFGRSVSVPRLTAWMGDATYRYSGITNQPRPWTGPLAELRDRLGRRTGTLFNSVLMNQYRDGSDHVSWHSDDEPELGPTPVIASVSLGADRRFALRSKSKEPRITHEVTLCGGSLLVMSGKTQEDWQHCLRKESKPVGTRVNLTFRKIDTAPH